MLVKVISIMLRDTYTTDDLVDRLGLMRKYYGLRLFTSGHQNTTLVEALRDDCDQAVIEVLQSWIDSFEAAAISPLVVYEALDAIEEDVAGLPSVVLYVPVRLPPEQVKRLGTWFREHVQPNLLMMIRTDPRATGGCGIIWNHRYHDLSLRYYIDKHRQDIITDFNQHMHA